MNMAVEYRQAASPATQETSASPVSVVSSATEVAPRAITVEMALYAGVFSLALFLRLLRLDAAPLSTSEAAQALAALRAGVPSPGGSPVLYAINSMLMSLFSASDAGVRLIPALTGSALALAPTLFRDVLGRLGALGAALILAVSPVALVASRSLDGEVIAVACALALIALLRRYQATRDERHAFGAAIVLGVGLTAGPGIYTALIAMGASALALRFAVGSRSDAAAPSMWQSLLDSPNRLKIGAALLGALILSATGAFIRPAGLGAAGDALTAWLAAFRQASGSSAFDIVQVLIVYEPLALVVGLVGLGQVLAGRRRVDPPLEPSAAEVQPAALEAEAGDSSASISPPSTASTPDLFGAWLGFAAIIAATIIVLQAGRRPIDLLLPIALLALLAAHAIQPWAETMRAKASMGEGVLTAVGLVIWARIAMFTTMSVTRPDAASVEQLVIAVAIISVSGLLLDVVLDIGLFRPPIIRRAAATLGLALLLLASFAAGWGATQVRVGDAREIVFGPDVTTLGARALANAAEQIAISTQGHVGDLPIRVEVDDPVVAWYLRDARPPAGQAAMGVVTLFGQPPECTRHASCLHSGGQPPQPLDAEYIGARFTLRETWDTLGLNVDAWLEWVLFRASAAEPPLETQAVTLWRRR
jgi:uncharacterized protein (TIGR03663 family)